MKNNFSKSIFYSYVSVLLTSLIGFITIPLSLNYFGKDLFGLLSITSDTLAYLALFNFGIPIATATIFAKLVSFKKQKTLIIKAQKLLFILGLIMIALISIFGAVFPNWINFISNLNENITPIAKLFIKVSLIFFIIRLPFSLFTQLLIFINRVYLAKLIEILSSFLAITSLLWVICFKLTIVQYAVISGFISLVPLSLSIIIFMGVWRKESWQSVESSNEDEYVSYWHLMNSSFYFFLSGIGSLIIWNTDSLVISHYLGLGETASYAIMFKFFTMLFMIITQLLNIVKPLYPKLLKEGKFDLLIKLFDGTTKFFPIIGGLIFILLFGFFKDFVILWTHSSTIFIGYLSCFAMGLYCYFLCSSVIPYWVMASLNYSKEICLLTILDAAINLSLSIYLVTKIGVAGVVFATLISHFITMFLLVPIRLDKLLPGLFRFDFLYVVKHLFFATAPAGCAIYFLNLLVMSYTKIIILIVICVCYIFISLIILGKQNIMDLKQLVNLLRLHN
ncbi:MAG: oligosaccharide flippase family protein [Burkholderiales bacterium]|nr:oligosaccharide flippase family protein [Burkholderiales bacterium]